MSQGTTASVPLSVQRKKAMIQLENYACEYTDDMVVKLDVGERRGARPTNQISSASLAAHDPCCRAWTIKNLCLPRFASGKYAGSLG